LDSFRPYVENPHRLRQNALAPLVKVKLYEILHCILLSPARAPFLSYCRRITGSKVQNLLGFLEENFAKPYSLEEFDQASGRSFSAFKKDFKGLSPLSPSRWIMEKRLERAHTLLSISADSIAEVCERAGFINPSHFSKRFKEKYGLSPREHQKVMQSMRRMTRGPQ
jgi:transcriptional regulator GlxA family with amidase domain